MKIIIKKHLKLFSIVITLITSFVLGYVSIELLKDYGWTVFVFIPTLIGYLPPFIIGRVRKISKKESVQISFLTFLIANICLLLFAIEGLICILMAVPILSLFVWLGSYAGYQTHKQNFKNTTNINIILCLTSFGFLGFDSINEHNNLIPVKTNIIVNAPIETVWENVISFNKIEEPTDWIFKTGIAYPTDATIKGKGENAIRYCNFTTGSFVEPVTTWDKPNLLQFDVIEQPIPMNEFNPFWNIHPPHLDGYFNSKKGQFKLTKLSKNKTELEGTTWYVVDIQPEIYWKSWSDFIVHKIHKRVLNHIKIQSEKL